MIDREEIRRKREERNKRKKRGKLLAILIMSAVLIILVAIIVYLYKAPAEIGRTEPTAVPSPVATAEPLPTETAAPTEEPTEILVVRRGTAQPIPEDVRSVMSGLSMTPNDNISYDDLSYLTIPHYDFSYNVTEGHLVVNAALAQEVLDIFAELFDAEYPIERMELVDYFDADDYLSIEHNNTSAFNYRESTDGTGRLSRHALGRAIDINPQINPYVNANGTGAHENAAEYWSRDTSEWSSDVARAAYIGPGTEIYRIFVEEHGWTWGGSWSSYRDYQHFQK